MIRRAIPGDEARLDAFLARHAESSMFLRGNLAAHGLEPSEHPHSTAYWLAEREDGTINAVFARANNGFLLAQAPGATPALWQAFARVLSGRRVAGMTGDAPQVEAALAALGFGAEAFRLNHGEPLYRLDLAALDDPGAVLRRPGPADIPRLTQWFTAYFGATGFAEGADAAGEAALRARGSVAEGTTVRLMIDGGEPVAMAGINARMGGMVQVGGVFVPEAARNRGLGRRVTAALLAEARAGGARRAILFANNAAAARAYEAIGFERVGEYRVALLREPRVVGEGA